jgi:hypothetical protein
MTIDEAFAAYWEHLVANDPELAHCSKSYQADVKEAFVVAANVKTRKWGFLVQYDGKEPTVCRDSAELKSILLSMQADTIKAVWRSENGPLPRKLNPCQVGEIIHSHQDEDVPPSLPDFKALNRALSATARKKRQ